MFVGVRTTVNLRKYSNSISAAAPADLNLDHARNLSRDIDQIMTVVNLPVIKQIFELFGLNFVPIKNEIKSIVSAAPENNRKLYFGLLQ